MRLYSPSIRGKIIYGFSIVLILMGGTAFMMYGIMRQMEHKIIIVEVIDDFLKLTLELRRFEKNYLLYAQEKDFQDNGAYWLKMGGLLEKYEPELRRLVSPGRIEEIRETMGEYLAAMSGLHGLPPPASQGDPPGQERTELEKRIRASGKDLTDFAEQTALAERASIKSLLQTTRSILVFSALASVLLLLALGFLLGRGVLSSLRLLEGYTKKVAQGEMLDLPTNRMEAEISALLRAFHRMTLELRLRQRQLVRSEKLAALGTLLAGVAHELNNPLSNISTSAQILAEEIEDGDIAFQKNLLARIEEQTDKSRDIVRTLLEFSRAKEFHKETLVLRALLEETLRLIRGQVPTEVEIAIDIPDSVTVFADKQRLQQVFLNLVKNGIDAVGDKGHVWVSARPTRTENREEIIEVIVEDDGPGIDPEARKKIFDPFFTTKDVGKGSGLGLFVVHDIIESHGGGIMVESRPGQGTSFIIWLKADEKENM